MLKIGSVLEGKYKILSEVGHGGMSTVYLAQNERANKNWAIKELRKNGSSQYDVVKQNLITETEILKKLHNPHLPSIVDVIDLEDTFVIVMDYVEGNDLGALVKKGPQPEKKVVDWGKQLCDVLAYLHAQNPPIIYRDMKPSNVRLRPDGMIMLLDFGTAREYKSHRAGDDTTCLGTRGYAAPEQYGGLGQTDARTDIYCLGATLYHLVTGHNPGMPPYEMKPIRQLNPNLSDGLEKIILTCTRPNPDERYQSCAELWYDLDHLDEIGRAAQRSRTNKLVAFGSAVAASLIGAMGMFGFWKAEESAIKKNYDIQIEAARTASGADKISELENKKHIYKEAVKIDAGRSEAYVNLLDYTVEDGALSPEEISALLELLSYTDAAIENNAEYQFKTQSPDEYIAFQYNLGLDYLFYYASEGGIDNSIRTKARDCFSTVINAEGGAVDKEFAELLYNITDATIDRIQKRTDEEILGLFENLTAVVDMLEDGTDLTAEYNIRIYRYTVNSVNYYLSDFAAAGVKKEQVNELLGRIEELLLDTSLNKDGNNAELIQSVRDNIQSVKGIVDLKYKK